MPVSVVVGGQFGSEGKGKIAYEIARRDGASVAIRVGGPNSGHTVIDASGEVRRFQCLPTAAILPDVVNVIAPGSYIDTDILLREIRETGLTPDQLLIDPRAVVITEDQKDAEAKSGLRSSIGSTLSGTGAAVMARVRRDGTVRFAENDARLDAYTKTKTTAFLRDRLKHNNRIVVEGTQGFGLSVLHGADYPHVTSRDTSAAGFVSEAGLSPRDIDDVVMVVRAFPIRVSGNSGPLPREIDWETVRQESGYRESLVERTTVTNNVRRVARFDAEVVRRAIECNNPSRIVLNHLDYIDANCRQTNALSAKALEFLEGVKAAIDADIDFVGLGPAHMTSCSSNDLAAAVLA